MKKRKKDVQYKAEFAEQAYRLCLLGAGNHDLAKFFNTTLEAINNWRKRYPRFDRCVRKGKEEADARVAERMYMRAIGYEMEEEKAFCNQGEIIKTTVKKQVPPDVQAGIFWLKCRQPEYWQDKMSHEITGKDGGPIHVEVEVALVKALGKEGGKTEE